METAADDDIELACIHSSSDMMSFRYKWFRNGSEIVRETKPQLTVTRTDSLNSGYYCCKIFNSSANNEAINTHCTTVLFRGKSVLFCRNLCIFRLF